MLSRFFIARPIFACVVSAFIVIAGLAALRALPVAQFPDVVPPQVIVIATYPGATAETVAETVAAPLEQQINGVEKMLYMSSVSGGDGTITITVTFASGADPDLATISVNNRVQAALARLPEEVRRQGVQVLKSSSALLMIVGIQAPDERYSPIFLSNYVSLNIVDELKRIPGVGNVQNFAGSDYSMRVWLQPDKLAQLGITTQEVVDAIREQNSQYATGRTGREPIAEDVDFSFAVTAQGRFSEPEEFENIIVRTNPSGTVVHLRDVARVELGAQSYDSTATVQGKLSIPVGMNLQPGANAIEVSRAIHARMDELSKAFPPGMEYRAVFDTSDFVKVSIQEVLKTLVEAMVLVFLVVFLFLQNWRATLIPMLAMPVSLIGALAGMYLLGFSINTLTMFGMVLAIGIVVDDAIVVLENVERIIATEHLSAPEATIKAMKEVTGPIVAIVLVLTAVFLPVAFLGGLVGELYRQFAVTIALSVAISGFVALSLTPALCATLLTKQKPARNAFALWFTHVFERTTARYSTGVVRVLRHAVLATAVFAVMVVATFGLYRAAHHSFVPQEDLGYAILVLRLPDAAALSRTERSARIITDDLNKNSWLDGNLAMMGFDPLNGFQRTNTAAIYVSLKNWDQRSSAETPGALIKRAKSLRLNDGVVLGFEPPPIIGLSNTGGFAAYLQSRTNATPQQIETVTRKFIEAASKRPELAPISTTFSASVPQIHVELDREKTRALGVKVSDVFTTLQTTFGALYVNDFNRSGRVFQVQMQSEPRFRAHPDDIRDVYLRSGSGESVPLTALVHLTEVHGPEVVQRFNGFPAADLLGQPATGYSSGQALAALEDVAASSLPAGYSLAWSGSYLQEKNSGNSSGRMYLLGLIMAFLVLAAQYERWTLPFAVILAVPFAAFGAFLAIFARGLDNDIFFQIGMITLIGLSAKNSVLIVEFALHRYQQGVPAFDAAVEAAKLRFRPIVMTSMAFVLGVVPLAISSGAGSNARHSIATGVIGGMLAATFIATFFVPLFFVWLMSWRGQRVVEESDSAETIESK